MIPILVCYSCSQISAGNYQQQQKQVGTVQK